MISLSKQIFNALQSINLIDDKEKRDSIFKDKTDIDKDNTTKKDFKKAGISSSYIFSYTAMQNVCSISKDFSKFLKDEGITKANKITPQLAKAFLQHKADEGCSARTLLSYKSALIKIDESIKTFYNCRGYCRGDDNIKNYHIEKPTPIDRRLTNSQVSTILENYEGRYSLGFKFQAELGLRFNELKHLSVNDFTIGQGETIETIKQGIKDTTDSVYIHSGTKGGLPRVVNIPTNKIEQIGAILAQFRSSGIDKPFKDFDKSCYNKAIKTISNSLGFGRCGSSHEFRKFYASTRYSASVTENMTEIEKKEIARSIISDLGHGRCRDDLIKTYIGNL